MQAHPRDVGLRRLTQGFVERPGEGATGDPGEPSEAFDVETFVEVPVDV